MNNIAFVQKLLEIYFFERSNCDTSDNEHYASDLLMCTQTQKHFLAGFIWMELSVRRLLKYSVITKYTLKQRKDDQC